MKYMKPELTQIGSAVHNVKSVDKESGPQIDLRHDTFTTNAYEADE